MRKVLILSVLFLLVMSARAQSFMFYSGDQPLDDNAEITVSDYQVFMTNGDNTILSMESGLQLKNITESDVQATVTQTILEGPTDGVNGYLSFCFMSCYTGNSDRTLNGSIGAGSFAPGYHDNFYVYQGIYNRIKVQYTVYLTGDASQTDKKTVTVTYVYDENSITRLNTPEVKPELTVFQEGNRMEFSGSFASNTCQLEIYAMTGQKIAQHLLTSAANETFILPEKLTKGVYLCVIKQDKQTIISKKFIVK